MATNRVSPTAHYTSWVWFRNDLSHAALASRKGWVLYNALRPLNWWHQRLGHRNLETLLLVRHATIDTLLRRAIEDGRVSQVLEIAAGMSGRGQRFARDFGDRVCYVESDLPPMAVRKSTLLGKHGLLGANHHVVAVDALRDDGPNSLGSAMPTLLAPDKGTAVITEGLIPYLNHDQLSGLWQRLARFLGQFPVGMYLSDIHCQAEVGSQRSSVAFQAILQAFVRSRVHLHFETPSEAKIALGDAGFAHSKLHHPGELGASGDLCPVERRPVVRVLEAVTRRPSWLESPI